MLLVALTGNIASGKSEVARILVDLGATLVDADELAREVVRPGTGALAAIVERWGTRVLNADGTLNRGMLRSIVFADPTERKALDAIVHPEVGRRRNELIADARARGDAVLVAAIPLLFEAGLEHDFDRVILVDASDDVRLSRLLQRGIDPAEARRIMAAQMPASAKRLRADVVIDNNATLEELRLSVERVWAELARESTA